MSNFCRGNRCKNRIGETWGPYVIKRAVGDNPETSLSFVLGCPECPHEVTRPHSGFAQLRGTKRCGGCGRASNKKEAAE
jgi:hypothetical protein